MPTQQTLLSSANCYLCFGVSLEEALELALLASIAGGTTPPVENFLTTDGGDPLVTDTNENLLAA